MVGRRRETEGGGVVLIWKTLHIISMVTMIVTFIGVETFYAAAVRRRDVKALAFVHRTVERTGLGFVALGALAAGVVFGLLTAATGGFDFVASWLVVAYVLVGAFLVNGFTVGERVVRIGRAAVKAEAGELPPEDVARDMASTRAVYLVAANAALFALIIADMTLKPTFF
jgi:uncharacterized membrane protein